MSQEIGQIGPQTHRFSIWISVQSGGNGPGGPSDVVDQPSGQWIGVLVGVECNCHI
jgi:hypothetical protein